MATLGAWIPAVLPTVVGIALVAVATLVLRLAGPRRPLHIVLFAWLYLLSGLKSLFEGFSFDPDGAGPILAAGDRFHAAATMFPDSAMLQRGAASLAFFLAPLLVAFLMAFPRRARLLHHPAGLAILLLPGAVAWVIYLAGADGGGAGWLPSYLLGVNVLVTVATGIAAIVLARRWRSYTDPLERNEAGLVYAGFLPAFLATWVLTGLQVLAVAGWPPSNDLIQVIATQYAPLLELVAAGIVALALLKYRVLGFELRFKGGVRWTLTTGAVAVVLYTAATLLDEVVLQDGVFGFAGPKSSAILSGVATVLMFRPLERLASRVSDRLFPATQNPDAYHHQRVRDIYRAQVRHVFRDAQVTDAEWHFLRRLRDDLGLGLQEAQVLETQARQGAAMLDQVDPRAPPISATSKHRAATSKRGAKRPGTGRPPTRKP